MQGSEKTLHPTKIALMSQPRNKYKHLNNKK